MSMSTPEIATLFGCLDSLTRRDGSPVSALELRTLAMNVNRLLAKEQQLCNLIWATVDAATVADGVGTGFNGIARQGYQRIHPPIACYKKPGSSLANLSMRIRVSDGDEVMIQVVTIGTGGRVRVGSSPPGGTTKIITGDNTINQETLDNIPIDPGPFERVEIWIKGLSRGDLGDEATYGANNKGTMNATASNPVRASGITDETSTWNRTGSGSPNYSSGGHYLLFVDSNDNPVVASRTITAISGNYLQFAPPLSPTELGIVANAGGYEIRELPNWSITNIHMHTVARTA